MIQPQACSLPPNDRLRVRTTPDPHRWKRSPVGPDRTPFVFTLEELQDAARGVNELNWRGHEHHARETDRITLQNRVIPTSAGPGAVSRYFFVELRLRPRRHWRNILFRGEAFSAS